MPRRRKSNPSQPSLFLAFQSPARTPGQRARIKRQWNESGRGDAEDAAEIARGILIDRLDNKLEELMELMQDEFGLKSAQAMSLFQKFQERLFPEAFDIDLDCEHRKQGLLPRCGGDKVTAAQLRALVEQLRRAG
jgi:hypothetical protein